MGKSIDWGSINTKIFNNLHNGISVKDTAIDVGVSYNTLCTFLRERSLDSNGHFKSKIAYNDKVIEFFTKILSNYETIDSLISDWGLTQGQVQGLLKKSGVRKEWNLLKSTSPNVVNGRRAEIYVKENCGFMILKDPNKLNSKSPWDLSIKGMGAVDVKATFLRNTNTGDKRWKFNVSSATEKRSVKFVICVGYDEDYRDVEVVLVIPRKDIIKKKSISVSKGSFDSSKYSVYVHRRFF